MAHHNWQNSGIGVLIRGSRCSLERMQFQEVAMVEVEVVERLPLTR
jgi:hypothetical protein